MAVVPHSRPLHNRWRWRDSTIPWKYRSCYCRCCGGGMFPPTYKAQRRGGVVQWRIVVGPRLRCRSITCSQMTLLLVLLLFWMPSRPFKKLENLYTRVMHNTERRLPVHTHTHSGSDFRFVRYILYDCCALVFLLKWRRSTFWLSARDNEADYSLVITLLRTVATVNTDSQLSYRFTKYPS